MKITIEPTDNRQALRSLTRNHSVTLEVAHDDVSPDDFFDLLRRAAVAWGFSEETVKEYMGPEQ